MKKLISLTLMYFMTQIAFGQTDQLKPVDAKNGYKDLIFETPLDSFLLNRKTLKIPSKNSGTETFKLLDSKYLSVGDCKIQEVDVIFFEKKLMEFNIKLDKENKICYLNALYYAWGSDLINFKGKDHYIWNGDKCLATFEDDPTMTSGTIVFFTKALSSEFDTYKQNKDKSNSSSL